MLTCKDLLVEVAKRAHHSGATPQDTGSGGVGVVRWAGPEWLPETYNLLYELPRFVCRHTQKRERYIMYMCTVYPETAVQGCTFFLLALRT